MLEQIDFTKIAENSLLFAVLILYAVMSYKDSKQQRLQINESTKILADKLMQRNDSIVNKLLQIQEQTIKELSEIKTIISNYQHRNK